MKWAAFEETIGSIDEAREILRQLVAKYPMLLEARYYMQKVHIYLEYHNVCPLVRIGTPPPPPLPQASVSLPQNQRGGEDTLACGWGGGGSQLGRLYSVYSVTPKIRFDSLCILYFLLLCCVADPDQGSGALSTPWIRDEYFGYYFRQLKNDF